MAESERVDPAKIVVERNADVQGANGQEWEEAELFLLSALGACSRLARGTSGARQHLYCM